MFFKENKRFKNKEDKQKMLQFKKDIFNEDIPIATTIKKYFTLTTEVDNHKNIAYKNTTCKSVSDMVRKNMNRSRDYDWGEKLICRIYT